MRCELCHGLGKLTYDELPAAERAKVGFGSVFPCPRCAGSGIDHCCDGMRACDHDGTDLADDMVGMGSGDPIRAADLPATPVRPGGPAEGMDREEA